MMKAEKAAKIRVTLIRSPIGRKPEQRATVKALGLGKLNSAIEINTNDALLGMVKSISHLVRVEDVQ